MFPGSAPWCVKLVQRLVQASWREGLAAAHLLMDVQRHESIPLLAGHVKRGVYRWLWGQDSFMSADRWGCGSTLFIVRPEASQHWSLQALGGAQVVTSGELTPVNALGASVTGFLASAVSHRGRLPPLEKAPSSAVGSAVSPRESQCSALGLGVCNICALPQSGVSVPQSLELPLEPRGLQSQTLWGLLFQMPDPQASELVWNSRVLTPVGAFL